MTIIQIIIVLSAFVGILGAIGKSKKGQLPMLWTAVWVILWMSLAAVAIRPEFATRLADILGVGRGVDALMYGAIIILFWGMFRIVLRIEQLEHHITLLVRELGMREAGISKTKDNDTR